MKKMLLALAVFICTAYVSNSQTTYYYRGATGTAGSGTVWSTATNWTINADGSTDGIGRTVSAANDILIIDGNILQTLNASKTAYLSMPKDICGSLAIQNGAIVYITSHIGINAEVIASSGITVGAATGTVALPVTGTATTFTSQLKAGDYVSTLGTTLSIGQVLSIVDDTHITCTGDFGFAGTALYRIPTLVINTSFTIDATSQLHMGFTSSAGSQVMYCIYLASTATGSISGSLFWQRNGCQTRVVAVTPGALVFQSGSNCTIQANPAAVSLGSSTAGPFFGTALGTGLAGGAPQFAFNTNAAGVTFASGSTYTVNFAGREYTPFGRAAQATTPLTFSGVVNLQPGSNYIITAATTYYNGLPYFYSSTAANYGNIAFNCNGTVSNLSLGRVDNLTFGTTVAAVAASTGSIKLYGDVLNSSPNSIALGNLTLAGATAQTIGGTGAGTFSATNLSVSNNAGITLSKALSLSGSLSFGNIDNAVLNTGGLLTLASTSTSTARIADITNAGVNSGNTISGNVTIQRFIPAKSTRRFSFITSPVSQSLSAAWQQQVHITGAGTGGTPCPGPVVPHGNGFDATVTNAPSMFSYDASQASGSRWVANTTGTSGFTLMPGTGYRLNVRGPRTTGCALLDGTTTATTAVTLSATGVVSNAQKNLGSFSNTYNNNLAGNWVLIGNPYPSELNFTTFLADAANAGANASAIGSSYIIYDPANAPDAITPANMYSTWNAGTWSNAATSISGANGQYIANGQAFFVQATAAANLTLNFAEAYKATVAQNGVFRQRSWNDIIRIGLNKDAVNIDNTVIRYANENGVNNNQLGDLDATLLSTGNSYLGTLKAGKLTSIQTRSLQTLASDTVALDFNAAASGNYSFNFSEHDNFAAANIYLLDNYSKTTTEIKVNPVYSFTIDKNNAATQTNRFALVFSKAIVPTVITGIKVYPNPADKQITVQLPAIEGKYTVSITDVAGKRVYQGQLAAGTQTINIAKLIKGNYVLELTDAKGNRSVEKIVKL